MLLKEIDLPLFHHLSIVVFISVLPSTHFRHIFNKMLT